MHISDIYHVYSRYIPDISHYSLYHHITLKDGRLIPQKNRSVHCTYSSKQYMYSNGWNPGFIQKNYSGYIPGIFLEYPREKYIPGIYLVYTRKNISGDSRWQTQLLLWHYYTLLWQCHNSVIRGNKGTLIALITLLWHYYDTIMILLS